MTSRSRDTCCLREISQAAQLRSNPEPVPKKPRGQPKGKAKSKGKAKAKAQAAAAADGQLPIMLATPKDTQPLARGPATPPARRPPALLPVEPRPCCRRLPYYCASKFVLLSSLGLFG